MSGGIMGYLNPILSHFCLFSDIFVFFFSFTPLNHVIFGFQLVQGILMHIFTVFALGKFKIVVFQGVSGVLKPYFSHFYLFYEILFHFLQFSILESYHIWCRISLEYPSAYVYSCFSGKIQNQGLSGGIRGCENPILSLFCLFF